MPHRILNAPPPHSGVTEVTVQPGVVLGHDIEQQIIKMWGGRVVLLEKYTFQPIV